MNYELLKKTISENFDVSDITEIVSGGAVGADYLGQIFAQEFDKKITIYTPDWSTYGKSAGMIRNRLIIESSDSVIAFWDGASRGTKNSIDLSKKNNKPIIIVNV
jgi:predicted Rossmann fold nucleotide-binding protein DprA/Smf involved in DNA uptake